MVDFLNIINSSIAWTKTVLFKPFNWRKWLILGFVALLSGTISSGSFNLNLPLRNKDRQAKTASTVSSSGQVSVSSPDVKAVILQIRNSLRQPEAILLIILGIALVLLILAFITWLHARFSFVFLEDVFKNDASVRAPFRSTKVLGDSFFGYSFSLSVLFTVFFSLLFVFLLRDILRLTIFNQGPVVSPVKIIIACLPYAAVIFPTVLFFAFLWVFIQDIVLVVMYRDKTKFGPAFLSSLKIISGNKKNFLVYVLVKLILGIAAAMIYMVISLVSLLVLIIPLLLLAGLVYLISLLSHIAAVVFVIIVVIPLGLGLVYCLLCLGLPVAVFFRTLSIKFTGRLDKKYDLFGAQDEIVVKSPEHSPELAATLSFVVAGLGQFYNGQIGKGILVFLTSCLIFPWIIGIIDAYNTAKEIKTGGRPVKSRTGCMVVFVSGILILFISLFIAILLTAVVLPYFMQPRSKIEVRRTVVETERR